MATFVLFKVNHPATLAKLTTNLIGCFIQVRDTTMYGGSQTLPVVGEFEVTDATAKDLNSSRISQKRLTHEGVDLLINAGGQLKITKDKMLSYLRDTKLTPSNIPGMDS